MQLQHHLSLQQQELMQQLQLVQRQYLIHQGFVKPLQIDFQTQNHAHSPTTATILQNMPTELNEQQCIESIQKPMYHNSQESHLEESFQEPHLLSPFQQNNELQHEKKYDNKTMHKKMEELYDSNDEHQNPQIYSERTQDPDSNHYYEANVTISAAVTPAISELKKKQQQELQVSYSNIISSICVNKKESNNAEHQHQSITPVLYNNGQQTKIQYPQTHHPLKQAYGSKSSELKIEDNNTGNDMSDNKSSSNVVSAAYINLQQKHDLYVTQSKQQEKHEHFQHRIRTATQPASYLTQAPLQFSTCNDHSAAVAVAAASINNTAVVASAGSSNFHNFFDVINSLGHEGCGSGEGRAGHHLDNFSTKKYYHPLYLHGVCRWPSCEMELDDVTSFIKHLNTDHSLNDCSTAQARVQMQVVSQLEIHLQKERDRLQAMLHHLYLTKQFLSPEKIELKDPNDDAFHSSSPNVGHINTTHTGSPILSSADITSIRKRISDKSPWTVTGEIQRNREFYKNADIRPPFTYASLIRQSIIESPDKQLTLNEIYNWFQNTFCYFRRNAATWKNAIRTNLSLHKCFVRYEDDFGSFWMVDDSEFVKRRHLSRGRPRKYESSLSPDTNTAQCGGSGDEGFRFSEKQQEQGKHNFNNVDDNNGGGNYGNEAGGTSYQRVSKDISKNLNKSNNKNKEGFKRENIIMGSGEDEDGVDGGGVDSDHGGYRIRCNYETQNMQHESLSNSPTYGNGSFSPKLKNIWAYQPIALEDAAALTMNSHFLRHNYSNYRNTTAGFKQQHSSNHDRNFMHKHCIHHQKQHHNLHHLQQHYQYKQQTTSSQFPQLFLTQLERRCQNVSVNSNGGAFKENIERQKHEERAYVTEECSGANDKLHNIKEPLLDLKLSPEDLTTIATTTPTPTPKTALILPTTTTDRNSPLSTVSEYITLRHPTDYGTDFQ